MRREEKEGGEIEGDLVEGAREGSRRWGRGVVRILTSKLTMGRIHI